MTLATASIARFGSSFRGEIVTPIDDDYDDARRVWCAVVDKRPALIVRPTDAADVASAIRFAREEDLPLAIRSGGHSIDGFSTCDGGMVLDLSRMRGATVDAGARTARTNGGAFLMDLGRAAQEHGLVCPVGRSRTFRPAPRSSSSRPAKCRLASPSGQRELEQSLA